MDKNIWQFFSKNYESLEIPRRAYGKGKEKIVSVNYMRVKHYIIQNLVPSFLTNASDTFINPEEC